MEDELVVNESWNALCQNGVNWNKWVDVVLETELVAIEKYFVLSIEGYCSSFFQTIVAWVNHCSIDVDQAVCNQLLGKFIWCV